MQKRFKNIILLFLLLGNWLIAQLYIPADPLNILETEWELFENNKTPHSLFIRPYFYKPVNDSNKLHARFESKIYYNTNAPNLENTAEKWIGRGASFFTSTNISYIGRYVLASVEPYYFINENREYVVPNRIPLFSGLNDNLAHSESPYQSFGLRETNLFAHYKGFGIGYSNANMWWGSSIHSSLMMTNNTTGFGHFMLGTLEEFRYKNWGFQIKYIFSKHGKKSLYEPYYNAVLFGATFYSNVVLSFGLAKAAQIGGTHTDADEVSTRQAMLAFLAGITAGDKSTYRSRWSSDDHTFTGYLESYFPKSKLKVFLEVGRNDIAWDLHNLILAPDHSIGTVMGLRLYEIFNDPKLMFGVEYAKLFSGRYIHRLFVGPWYNRKEYDYSKYDGRHWGAHSGPDSDDFLLYLKYKNKNISISPSFNFERHGVQEQLVYTQNGGIAIATNNPYAETKYEYRLDIRYKYKTYSFNLYTEYEILRNLEFIGKHRDGFVISMGIIKDLL